MLCERGVVKDFEEHSFHLEQHRLMMTLNYKTIEITVKKVVGER
jgi:hypothetical protein